MTGLTAFGVGIAIGYLLSVLVAAILTARGVYPHDPAYDDEPPRPGGRHGQEAP